MGTVTVLITLFEGEYYMCIEKKNGEYVNRINLNGTEWVNFHKIFVKILDQLDPKLEAFEKATLVRYYPREGEKVNLVDRYRKMVDLGKRKKKTFRDVPMSQV